MAIEKINAVDYVATYTANHYSSEATRQFQQHAINIRRLHNQYIQLQEKATQAYEALQRQHKYDAVLKDTETTLSPQAALYAVYRDEKQRTADFNIITFYLDPLKRWSLEAYQEIVSVRQFITNGQELQYDIEQGTSYSYRLTEGQYLESLAQGNLTSRKQSWDKITPQNLGDALSLTVTKPTAYVNKTFIGRSQDALTKHLYQYAATSAIEGEKIYDSRLYEMYSQIRYSLFKDIPLGAPIPSKIFDAKKVQTDKFIKDYISAKMHKDNLAFYKMGDSIENANTLIENKRTGATVSIKTLRNAIRELNNIVNLPKPTKAQLKQKLKTLYIQTGKSDMEHSIQDAAARRAKKGIDEVIKEINFKELK